MTKATTSTAKARFSPRSAEQGDRAYQQFALRPLTQATHRGAPTIRIPSREIIFARAALIAILILAAALRFGWVGVNSFAWDEARVSLDALRMARGGELILAGQPSSVDIPFFPASVWMFAIPFAISPDPLFATLVVAAVSLAMVYGVWSLARHFGTLPGLAAALVAAASPYAVFYGRSIWQPNLLAPLALLWLSAWYASVQGRGRGALIAAGLVGCVGVLTVQVHFAGAALMPATVYAVLRHHRGRKRIAAILGGGISALAMLPYLYYVTSVDPDVMGRFGGVLGGSAQIDLGSVENLLRLATGWDWAFQGSGDGDIYSRSVAFAAALGVGLALGVAALIAQRLRPDSQQTGRATLAEMTLVLLVASPLFFLRHSSPVQIHYQLIAFPSVPLALGAALTLFRTRAWRIAGFAAVGAAAAIWTAQIAAVLQSANITRPANSALSSILRESRDAAHAASEPVLFFTHGDDPALHGEAAVFESLLWDRPHRILNGDVLLILPPYPATLMATLAPFQMWEELEAGGLAADPLAFSRREGALPFVAAAYDGRAELEGFVPIPSVALGDGSTLLGWKVRYVGPRFRISTLWQVESDAPPGVFQQFHHLRRSADLDGDPQAISDVPLSRATWRVGDRVVVMADFFDVPAGDTWVVDVGHYTLPDLARVSGLEGGDRLVRLGPFVSAAGVGAE